MLRFSPVRKTLITSKRSTEGLTDDDAETVRMLQYIHRKIPARDMILAAESNGRDCILFYSSELKHNTADY